MIQINRILCPIDFSEFSRRALEHAVVLARWYDAEIKALYVQVPPPAVGGLTPSGLPALEASTREDLLDEVCQFVEPIRGTDVPLQVAVREGQPVAVILEQAGKWPADLLVIGTHGRSGFERLVLGSVTEKLVRKAACPVLTVPRQSVQAPAEAPVLFKRILCPVDFSGASMRALDYALSLAQEAAGRIVLLHVLEWFAEEEPSEFRRLTLPEYRRHLEEDARSRLARAVPEEARAWCQPEILVTSGRPHRQILRMAQEQAVDLIVMGVQGRGAVDLFMFGTTTHPVVREAPCPVLTIRGVAARGEERKASDRPEAIRK